MTKRCQDEVGDLVPEQAPKAKRLETMPKHSAVLTKLQEAVWEGGEEQLLELLREFVKSFLESCKAEGNAPPVEISCQKTVEVYAHFKITETKRHNRSTVFLSVLGR